MTEQAKTDADLDARLAAAFGPVRYRAVAAAAVPRFQVSVVRPDGTSDNYQRTGGSACDHAQEAQDAAGLGSVVRVVPLLL